MPQNIFPFLVPGATLKAALEFLAPLSWKRSLRLARLGEIYSYLADFPALAGTALQIFAQTSKG